MKKGTVHFTLGDDAGKLLMQIAQEALLYELDPEKAIKVITTSLMGCPDNIALKILKGNMEHRLKGGMVITIKGDTIEFYGGTLTYKCFGERDIRSVVIDESKYKED